MYKLLVNSLSIGYERRGKGMPLVLIHGYPLDHSIWEPVCPLLEKDFDLVIPNLPGFGDSELLRETSMATYAGAIAVLMDGLGIQKAYLAGHSMGGYIALAFARAFPERTLGLALVASQTPGDTAERAAGRMKEAESVVTNGVGDVADGMSVKLTADLSLQNWLKKLILWQRPDGVAAALGAMAARPDSTPFLSGFNFPILVIHGLADGLIPVEKARMVKQAVPGTRLVEIPGAGHMPMMEKPEETAKALLLFSEK